MLTLHLTVQKISLKCEEIENKRSHMTTSCFHHKNHWDFSHQWRKFIEFLQTAKWYILCTDNGWCLPVFTDNLLLVNFIVRCQQGQTSQYLFFNDILSLNEDHVDHEEKMMYHGTRMSLCTTYSYSYFFSSQKLCLNANPSGDKREHIMQKGCNLHK